MKYLVLVFLIFLSFSTIAQITSGIELSFNSAETSKSRTQLIQLKLEHLGYGISYYYKAKVLKFKKVIDLYLGGSLGYDYNTINHVVFHYSSRDPNFYYNRKKYISKLGLSYMEDKLFLDINFFDRIIFESGVQNRFLLYRHFGANNSKFKGNSNEMSNSIPWFYNDFYYSIGIKLGYFTLIYRIMDVNENVMIQDFDDPISKLGQQKPIVYKLRRINIFSLLIQLKSHKTDKLPLFRY